MILKWSETTKSPAKSMRFWYLYHRKPRKVLRLLWVFGISIIGNHEKSCEFYEFLVSLSSETTKSLTTSMSFWYFHQGPGGPGESGQAGWGNQGERITVHAFTNYWIRTLMSKAQLGNKGGYCFAPTPIPLGLLADYPDPTGWQIPPPHI